MDIDNSNTTAEFIQWTEFGIPIRNLWHLLLYAWDGLPLQNYGQHNDIECSPTLDALLASILIFTVKQRLRIGLGCNYVDEKGAIRGIKGRVNFTESIKRQTFERAQAYCEYQQYSVNAPKNQIVKSMCSRLVQTGQFGPNHALADDLRNNLRWLTRAFNGVDFVELKLDFIHRQQLGRNDGDYRLMLALCELILERQQPTEIAGHHTVPAMNRDALLLYKIYERFIANFYKCHLKGWTIMPQKILHWHEKIPNQYLPKMVPDVVLKEKSTGRIIILDTKFTAKHLITNQQGELKFNSQHLYQMYAYLKTQEHVSDQYGNATGILLYPAIHHSLSEKIELHKHTVRFETVDLKASWEVVERNLIGLIQQ